MFDFGFYVPVPKHILFYCLYVCVLSYLQCRYVSLFNVSDFHHKWDTNVLLQRPITADSHSLHPYIYRPVRMCTHCRPHIHRQTNIRNATTNLIQYYYFGRENIHSAALVIRKIDKMFGIHQSSLYMRERRASTPSLDWARFAASTRRRRRRLSAFVYWIL